MMCDLKDWLSPDSQVDAFDLFDVEGIWAGHQQVVRLRGTWRNSIKKTKN